VIGSTTFSYCRVMLLDETSVIILDSGEKDHVTESYFHLRRLVIDSSGWSMVPIGVESYIFILNRKPS
jgi:hypothetical protein